MEGRREGGKEEGRKKGERDEGRVGKGREGEREVRNGGTREGWKEEGERAGWKPAMQEVLINSELSSPRQIEILAPEVNKVCANRINRVL